MYLCMYVVCMHVRMYAWMDIGQGDGWTDEEEGPGIIVFVMVVLVMRSTKITVALVLLDKGWAY